MPAWIHSAKDNDLLLVMPIPTSMILLVRLSGIYAMGLLYELIVMIPTVLIWFGNAPVSVAGTVHVLLIQLVLSLLILVLSAILGRVVARIAAKVKHQNIITAFVSLVFSRLITTSPHGPIPSSRRSFWTRKPWAAG